MGGRQKKVFILCPTFYNPAAAKKCLLEASPLSVCICVRASEREWVRSREKKNRQTREVTPDSILLGDVLYRMFGQGRNKTD